jgi:hypothetical protein
MQLRALTNGAVTSTGTLYVQSGTVGGLLITTNNTNAAVVTLRRDDANGKQLIYISTITTMWITAPITMEETTTLYYSVSGTGASAQIYEWRT